jgi:hypothetical protein
VVKSFEFDATTLGVFDAQLNKRPLSLASRS